MCGMKGHVVSWASDTQWEVQVDITHLVANCLGQAVVPSSDSLLLQGTESREPLDSGQRRSGRKLIGT